METKKIVLWIMMLVVSTTTFAKWNGTSTPWTHGNGSIQQPFLIENAEQLAFLSDMVLSGTTYSNKYFKLTNNISLSNVKWTPIGNATNAFQGHFDGNGLTIDSIQIIDSCLELFNSERHYGLFGHTRNACIQHLTCNIVVRQLRLNLSHPVQISDYRIGGIIALAETTFVNNCQTNGVLYTNLVHSYTGTGTYGAVGGIVGRADHCLITNCSNYCDIYTQNFGGGIVGYAIGDTIRNCGNYGALYGDNTTNNTRSSVLVGGIAGGMMYSNIGFVQICKNDGSITVNGNSGDMIHVQAGGICANNSKYYSIEYCYNTGEIIATKTGPLSKGQICGIAPYGLKSCYNVGKINEQGFYFIYGAGKKDDGVVNSYYLNTCMPNNVEVQQGGIDRTEAQMKSVSFPAMLNTDSTVFVMDENGENGGFPIFGIGHNPPVSVIEVPDYQYKICTYQDRTLTLKEATGQAVMVTNVAGIIIYKTSNYANEIIRINNPGIYIIQVANKYVSKLYIN